MIEDDTQAVRPPSIRPLPMSEGHHLSRSAPAYLECPADERAAEESADEKWRLKIALALQRSLDVEDILEAFSNLLNERAPHLGLRFRGLQSANRIDDHAIGRSGAYSCRFRLRLYPSAHSSKHLSEHPSDTAKDSVVYIENERKDLGDILFFRDTPFLAFEKKEIASALPLLEFPLRNALIHKEAIRGMLEDPLTGSYNRAMMDDILKHEVENAARHQTPLSLMMIDIDHFKRINDRFGHLAGDGILIDFAHRIRGAIRKKDRLFRYGGDEFALLASHTDDQGIRRIEKRLRGVIDAPPFDIAAFDGFRNTISIRACFGVAKYRSGDGPLDLIARADKDLYREKRKVKNSRF
ncbi:GGDEF domain-containing protein [Thioalkalivibrio sp. HK1]|uniref:GGDEF domain-containing protein n=1 Tax=Thioalkalivibrio sp. HK1 TaxID=1469245 RepID=UPI0004711F94|nr:GGDEF domain-containing protein [Thioalkalivibrio sp. HK1]